VGKGSEKLEVSLVKQLDVRNDDAVRRLPEKQRSCQCAVVGSGAHPVYPSLSSGGFGFDDNSRRKIGDAVEDSIRGTRLRGPDIRGGSFRSGARHKHAAKVHQAQIKLVRYPSPAIVGQTRVRRSDRDHAAENVVPCLREMLRVVAV